MLLPPMRTMTVATPTSGHGLNGPCGGAVEVAGFTTISSPSDGCG